MKFIWQGHEDTKNDVIPLGEGFAWLICPDSEADALATVSQDEEVYNDSLFHWTVHGRNERGVDFKINSGATDSMDAAKTEADVIVATLSDEQKAHYCK